GHARVERGQVHLDGARAGGGLGGIHAEVAGHGGPCRGTHDRLERGVGLEGGARVGREHLEVHGLGQDGSRPRRGQDEGKHSRSESSHHSYLLVGVSPCGGWWSRRRRRPTALTTQEPARRFPLTVGAVSPPNRASMTSASSPVSK